MHMEGVTPAQVERMKKLNMFIAVNPREIVSGGLLHRVWDDRAFSMPPLKEIQDSGILWGLGTDRMPLRSEEHTSELQSHHDLVCRLLLEKKKTTSTDR